MAAKSSYRVEEGDVLLMGTDGLFDNMHEDMILDYISKYKVRFSLFTGHCCHRSLSSHVIVIIKKITRKKKKTFVT